MKINWKQARILRDELHSGSRESVTLEEAFAIFDLTKKEDLKTIKRVSVFRYTTNTLAGPMPSLSKIYVDDEGFYEIWDYAKEKDELLTEFKRHFIRHHYERMENRARARARGEW